MKLRNLTIGQRLAMAFTVLLLLLLATGLAGIRSTQRVNDSVLDLSENWLPSVQVLSDLRASANAARRVALTRLSAGDDATRERLKALRDEYMSARMPPLLARYEKLISSPDELKAYEAFGRQWQAYARAEGDVQALLDGGAARLADARNLASGDAATAFDAALAGIGELVDINLKGSDGAAAKARAGYRDALLFAAGLLATALLIGIALAVFISRSIVVPLAQAVQVAETVAAGDLTSQPDTQGRDEAAAVLKALAAMNDRLSAVVRQVRDSSDSIATGSSEIATGNADLSQRTEEQAGNLEQTAASMEELVSIVRSNSESAQQASSLAGSTAEAATQGGSVVARVVDTMQEIAHASGRIAEIIGVIDGIAFQTNILALNAAVEAARAGEQGRGFAVVASEVRSLAQRSADAAKEIRSLIGANMSKVEQGTSQATQAGTSMETILTQVVRVRDLVGEISGASIEQTKGIAQLGDAVTQLDRVTQQNAALVEQSAAAAESLRYQAQALSVLVANFRLPAVTMQAGAARPSPEALPELGAPALPQPA
jgi:methyl-accepting chemotaxis protein